ncbi:beta-1,6-N-acetylglucosaminyltransferase [Limosilactobacillus fermentum]|uniref:beta-1,6-N-acetylglucosaminyltransferase n=1 Tax=Limosilactobacillus fermentum TaxID=1613 RepID=UPI002F2656EF
MKHAIMVIGYGENAGVLQETINVLDDSDIDFYIHWDKRWPLPKLTSQYSKVKLVDKRIAVKWGSFTQVEAEKHLMQVVGSSYDYIHLISAMDMPLMTATYFKRYFTNDVYIGFSDPEGFEYRLEGYYPNHVDFRKHRLTFKLYRLFNRFFKVNRLKDNTGFHVHKGPNWFSIKGKYSLELLNSDLSMFEHSCFPDEEYVQSILGRFDTGDYSEDDNAQAARYIDWHRGEPYVFTEEDVPELKQLVNTNYAFARKVKDSKTIELVYNTMSN